jgi:hypothetical protein
MATWKIAWTHGSTAVRLRDVTVLGDGSGGDCACKRGARWAETMEEDIASVRFRMLAMQACFEPTHTLPSSAEIECVRIK